MLKHLLNPKNWFIGIAYLLIRLIILLPFSVLMKLGVLFGIFSYHVSRERRKIAEINIRLCFPELSDHEQQKLVKENFISTGKTFFEIAMAFWAKQKKIENLYEIKGLHHLEAALKMGRGVILLSAHLTMFDLAIRMLNMSLDKPIHMMYRKDKNAFLASIIDRARSQYSGKIIGKKELGKMLESLADNNAVWYAPDQNFSYHMVFAPFFNISAATVTGTSRIARESGATVVPFFFYRKPTDSGYLIELFPALENFPCGDDYQDTVRINQIIENAIRKHPEQYLWTHRRFKTRPPGELPIYSLKKKRR